MSQTQTGWFVFIAALGLMATQMQPELTALATWNDMLTPRFVGNLLGHFGAVVGAFVAGKVIPTKSGSST